MKLNVKKVVFACIYLIAILALCLWRMPLSMQTDLNSLTQIHNTDWPINELTTKFSNVINVIVKSENLGVAKHTAGLITNTLSTNKAISVINTNISVSDAINKLSEHKNSFLSTEYRNLLQKGEFKPITNKAVTTISSSFVPNILSLTEDPFLLATNYLKELKSTNTNWENRDVFLWQYNAPNHYILISANIDVSNTKNLVKNVRSISETLRKYNNKNAQVFISGIPVHTANMTQTSKLQLSVFSLVAIIAAILLNLLLFRKITTLIPVILSMTLGFITGSTVLFLCFPQPHILTFVFGVTLIGLGIDYSFHFINALNNKDSKNVYTNILHSFLTTFVCFLPLMFSGLSLLQQISVFTLSGLTSIYIGWLVFAPQKINIVKSSVAMPKAVSKKYRPVVIIALIIAILATLPFMKTQNNMSQLYRPNSELLQSETLLQNLNGDGTSQFLLMRGKNLDDVLTTSEKIKDESGYFVDLSTIIPSKERQVENQNLIRLLYKSEAKKIRHELGLRTTPKFIDTPIIKLSDIKDNKNLADLLDKFMFNGDKYVYLIANVPQNFKLNNPNAIIISPTKQITTLMEAYSHESYRLLTICTIALVLLLMALYGKKAFIYLTPSILAVGLTAATLTWFNQPITFFHLLSLFIVIGLTLDYSIFHINAIDKHEIKPVLFSFLTSLVGFGILGFASFFLIHSMGVTLGLGLTFGYLISLFLFRR